VSKPTIIQHSSETSDESDEDSSIKPKKQVEKKKPDTPIPVSVKPKGDKEEPKKSNPSDNVGKLSRVSSDSTEEKGC
jgi:hypothetical protein